MNAQLESVPLYALESIDGVWGEIQPLLQAHWEEIAHYPDIELAPDYDRYRAMEAACALRIFTVRLCSRLIGYAIYFVGPAPHYRKSLWAQQDVLFLHPDYRRGTFGMRLIMYADQLLKEQGVQITLQHVKAEHDFGPLLQRLGYELVDHLYMRRLDQ